MVEQSSESVVWTAIECDACSLRDKLKLEEERSCVFELRFLTEGDCGNVSDDIGKRKSAS